MRPEEYRTAGLTFHRIGGHSDANHYTLWLYNMLTILAILNDYNN